MDNSFAQPLISSDVGQGEYIIVEPPINFEEAELVLGSMMVGMPCDVDQQQQQQLDDELIKILSELENEWVSSTTSNCFPFQYITIFYFLFKKFVEFSFFST